MSKKLTAISVDARAAQKFRELARQTGEGISLSVHLVALCLLAQERFEEYVKLIGVASAFLKGDHGERRD